MNTLGGRGPSEGCNIKINPEGIGFENVDWFPRAQVRNLLGALVKAVMNLHFPQFFRNFLKSLGGIRSSK